MKRIYLFALMAFAILLGCKKNGKTSPDSSTPDEPVKWDTAFADVYLTIYVSPLLYEYSDFEFYRYYENGDSVRLASAERTMDTLGTDYSFYNHYKAVADKYYPPLDSFKVFQTTEKLTVNNATNTICRVVAVRNSNKFDLQKDTFYGVPYMTYLVPVDKALDPSLNFGCPLHSWSSGIWFEKDEEYVETKYKSIIRFFEHSCQWHIRYYVSI